MTEGTRVIGYVRISTEEQETGAGIEAQRKAIQDECARRGWQLVRIEQDIASGRSMNREGLRRVIESIESGEAGGLVVSKLDRLSRSVQDFAALLARFQRHGWGLVVMDLGVDTSTIMGAAMAQMVSVFAELERKRIGERTKEALAVRRAQGVRLGRPPRLPPETLAYIRELRARGLSLAAIARQLDAEGIPTAGGGPWRKDVLSRLLARDT